MQVQELRTPAALERGYGILKELRTELSYQEFVSLYEAAKAADGYTLVGVFENEKCIAVMGYRLLSDFVHGKHIYIDDIVVTKERRSGGIGADLLRYAEKMAVERGCKGLRLCTGIENETGRRFYEREGWAARALAFKKLLA